MKSRAIPPDKFNEPVWRMVGEESEASVSIRTNRVAPRNAINGM
jgi:hypothetical protein